MINTAQKGFTLAELLIALALLGIIAAFTIPKVLQATGQGEATAKVREAISTLEQGWYAMKGNPSNPYTPNATLYANLTGKGLPAGTATASAINAVEDNAGAANAVGAPFNGIAPAHPCGALTGWVRLHNGTVMAGLAGTVLPPTLGIVIANNDTICIDYNGAGAPNAMGADIFVGNFNSSGDFDGAAGPNFVLGVNSKNFNWGSATTLVHVAGAPAAGEIAAPFAGPLNRAGIMLR